MKTDRLLSFSDSIFAFAITLLVLDIKLPPLSLTNSSELLSYLLSIWPIFLTYIVSVALIGIFWLGHGVMFAFIQRADRKLLWLNTALLAGIAFLPFPTSLLARYLDNAISVRLYGAVFLVISLMYFWIWQYTCKNKELLHPKTSETIKVAGRKAILLAPVIYALALILSFWSIRVSVGIYLLIPILYLLPSPIDKLVQSSAELE